MEEHGARSVVRSHRKLVMHACELSFAPEELAAPIVWNVIESLNFNGVYHFSRDSIAPKCRHVGLFRLSAELCWPLASSFEIEPGID